MADSPALAMIALAEPKMPEIGHVVKTLKDHWPACPLIQQDAAKNDVAHLEIGTAIANYALMPTPIPWKQLEDPCQTAWWWPEAAQSLKGHKAHLIVVVSDPKNDCISRWLLLTRVVAALLTSPSAIGVYWGAAGLVHANNPFIEQTLGMSREYLPLNLWIDFGINKSPDGELSGFTSGLAAFGQMELEIDHAKVEPAHLRDRLFNIAHYLLDHGPILKDGETIGLSAEERIKIQHQKSRFDQRGTVIKLEL